MILNGKIVPTQDRACGFKIKLGRHYAKNADRMAKKHGKQYGVYLCPYCQGHHLTTKIEVVEKYFPALLYVTAPIESK